MNYLSQKKARDKVLSLFMHGIKQIGMPIDSIYLFGSRARETARPDSDYDLLLVIPQKAHDTKSKFYDLAVNVFCATDADISLKILNRKEFKRLSSLRTPFIESVLEEGIRLA